MQTIDNIDLFALKERLPLFYVEHGKLSFSNYSFVFSAINGKYQIPLCSITTLLIGPGVSITSDFVANASKTTYFCYGLVKVVQNYIQQVCQT